jgi:hypothetical protein
MSQEYYSLLAHTIRAVGQDEAQRRTMVYEFARVTLRKALCRQYLSRPQSSWQEIERQITALETAIDLIESDVAGGPMRLGYSSDPAPSDIVEPEATGSVVVVRESGDDPGVFFEDPQAEVLPPAIYTSPRTTMITEPLPAIGAGRELSKAENFPALSKPPKALSAALWSTIQLVLAATLGVALYVAITDRGAMRSLVAPHELSEKAASPPAGEAHTGRVTSAVAGPLATAQPLAGMPRPSAYGVYAIDHGKLIDLQSLPIRVPDLRIGVSPAISTPSANTLADGQLEFVVFQRDLVNTAPDKIMVRIVARVRRELKFNAKGEARIVKIDGSWAIRNKAYEMKVIPVDDNPAMVIVRPERPFPPGRYALVLKNVGYDFTVAGAITDPFQCLELTDAVDMPIYSECRTP